MRTSRETIGERSLKHGHLVGRRSSTYSSWRNAKTRCFNTSNAKYLDYGARGITMCAAWANDFRAFLADMGECPPGHTIEREDVNGNYEPGNCHWIIKPAQAMNKRTTHWVVLADGSKIPLLEFARNEGVNYPALWWNIKHGKSPQEAAGYLRAKMTKRLAVAT